MFSSRIVDAFFERPADRTVIGHYDQAALDAEVAKSRWVKHAVVTVLSAITAPFGWGQTEKWPIDLGS